MKARKLLNLSQSGATWPRCCFAFVHAQATSFKSFWLFICICSVYRSASKQECFSSELKFSLHFNNAWRQILYNVNYLHWQLYTSRSLDYRNILEKEIVLYTFYAHLITSICATRFSLLLSTNSMLGNNQACCITTVCVFF